MTGDYLILSLLQRPGIPLWRTHEVQHCYREALFGQTLFEVLQFNFAQIGPEQALIPINVVLMNTYAGNSFAHNGDSHKTCFKCPSFKDAILNVFDKLNMCVLRMPRSHTDARLGIRGFDRLIGRALGERLGPIYACNLRCGPTRWLAHFATIAAGSAKSIPSDHGEGPERMSLRRCRRAVPHMQSLGRAHSASTAKGLCRR